MSAVAPVSTDTPPAVPKWVYALAIGIPVTAALAYILFGPGDEKPKKKPKAKSVPKAELVDKPSAKTTVETPTKKEAVKIEDVKEEQEPTDPLEKAVAAKNKGDLYCENIMLDSA